MERREELVRLCKKYQVDILYSFGSRAKEIYRFLERTSATSLSGSSDADIGILVKTPLSVDDKVSLVIDLEDFFQVGRVDLVSLAEADPFLAANIVRGELLYARDQYEADEYELYILRRAGDLAPLERERMDLILREGK